jgi:two-component system nitrogen regulation response regulator NtrX
MPLDVLIVDDEADIREIASDILKDEGYTTRTAANSSDVFAKISERVPGAVILDVWLQGSDLDGLGILEILKSRYPQLPVIVISGHGNIETAVSAIRMGAYDYLEKPFKEDKLLLTLSRAIENTKLKHENAALKKQNVDAVELIGSSSAVSQLNLAISRVAPTESRVMITGPCGAGKEVVAQMIHAKSRRKRSPFIVFNAAGYSPREQEEILFGREPALSSGGEARVGAFERAHGGTLFIDEVVDVAPEVQARLLRVLQQQHFTRVDGKHEVKVDVRVIAATSQDIHKAIEAKRFRTDLYYRLNVVPIDIPPLADRREDIPDLANYFMEHLTRQTGLPKRSLATDTLAIMQAYHWPGNVRELKNTVERLLIISAGETDTVIRPSALPHEVSSVAHVNVGGGDNLNETIIGLPLREAREQFERQYLLAQLNRFGGNISRTSAFIGMERSALHRKLKMLGIHNSEVLDAA